MSTATIPANESLQDWIERHGGRPVWQDHTVHLPDGARAVSGGLRFEPPADPLDRLRQRRKYAEARRELANDQRSRLMNARAWGYGMPRWKAETWGVSFTDSSEALAFLDGVIAEQDAAVRRLAAEMDELRRGSPAR